MSQNIEGVTTLLGHWAGDSPGALDRLMPRVVDDLRRLARHHVGRLGATPTLQPTAIVNEAFLRLANKRQVDFASRSHFFAFASKVIRDLLVDHLRRRQAKKRGGGLEILPLEAAGQVSTAVGLDPATVLRIHEILGVLERRDPRRGRVVELRYFGGLTIAEIADVTHRSKATVERDWQVARRWLAKEISSGA